MLNCTFQLLSSVTGRQKVSGWGFCCLLSHVGICFKRNVTWWEHRSALPCLILSHLFLSYLIFSATSASSRQGSRSELWLPTRAACHIGRCRWALAFSRFAVGCPGRTSWRRNLVVPLWAGDSEELETSALITLWCSHLSVSTFPSSSHVKVNGE